MLKVKNSLILLGLSLTTTMAAAAYVQKEPPALKPIPEDRVLYRETSGTPIQLETYQVTGKCGMSLWIDKKLAFIIKKDEKTSFLLPKGRHEIRLTYEPLPKEPRNEEEKERYKYCYKEEEEPQKLGYVKEVEIKEDTPYLLHVRTNRGNLFRFRLYENAPQPEKKYPFY